MKPIVNDTDDQYDSVDDWRDRRTLLKAGQCPVCETPFRRPTPGHPPKLIRCSCGNSFHPEMSA